MSSQDKSVSSSHGIAIPDDYARYELMGVLEQLMEELPAITAIGAYIDLFRKGILCEEEVAPLIKSHADRHPFNVDFENGFAGANKK